MIQLYYLINSYLKYFHLIPKNIYWRLNNKESDLKCVFILGTPRSGTTLLQKIIEAHSDFFSIQSESAIFSFQNIFDKKRKHFNLSDRDLKDLIKISSSQVEFFKNAVVHLKNNNNKTFVEKTPQHINRMKSLMRYFPNSKFVVIVRDGRDCYCSAKKHPYIPQSSSVSRFAKYYAKCINSAIKNYNKLNCYTIYYEKLVTNPIEELKKLMIFLESNFEESQIDSTAFKKDKRAKQIEFRKLNEPISTQSIKKYKHEMSPSEIITFNKITSKQLEFHGYDC